MRALRSPATRRALPALAAVALALGVAGAVADPWSPPARADQLPECPDDGEMPDGGNLPAFTDNAISVFAGGDYTATGSAAESEGLLVVMGDASFTATDHFNVGSVGVGSGIVPSPGHTMLAVGGTMTIGPDTVVEVGANVVDADGDLVGGAVDVGADIVNPENLDTNGGTITTGLGADAVAEYSTFPADMQTSSDTLTAAPVTGSATVSAPRVTFAGDGTSDLQVFEIDAATLGTLTEVDVTNVPDDAAVAVNVTGGPLTFSPNWFSRDGVRMDGFGGAGFGNFAASLLWNIADAESVTIGGSSQFMGSILAPAADVTITASTNGRVLVGGDLTTSGQGNEQHNYPWTPEFPCDDDTTVTASVSVTKAVTPGSPLTGLHFSGTALCAGGSVRGLVPWTVADGDTTTYTNVPVGTVCVVSENLDAVWQDVDGERVPVDIGGLQWADPVVMIDGEPTNTFAVTSEDQVVEIVVTNTLLATFDVTKLVEGPDGGYVGDRDFDVDWSCSADAYVDGDAVPGATSGTIGVADGETAGPTLDGDPALFPAGTTCTLAEELVELPGDFADDDLTWQGSTIEPAELTVGLDTSGLVSATVTNTFAGPTPTPTPTQTPTPPTPTEDPTEDPTEPGGELPDTGTGAAALLGVAGALLVGGAATVLLARRRAALR